MYAIEFGSILYMRVVGISETATLSVPLDILSGLAADFDGDVLNILYIINEEFRIECEKVYNPKNSMMIQRGDGWANPGVLPFKDILINANTLVNESRQFYTKEQKEKLMSLVAE